MVDHPAFIHIDGRGELTKTVWCKLAPSPHMPFPAKAGNPVRRSFSGHNDRLRVLDPRLRGDDSGVWGTRQLNT